MKHDRCDGAAGKFGQNAGYWNDDLAHHATVYVKSPHIVEMAHLYSVCVVTCVFVLCCVCVHIVDMAHLF